jgi:hypothetical protein
MPGIPFTVTGRLFTNGEQTALLLSHEGDRHLLRLGYIFRGSEEIFLPETLLDDWGHEVRGVELYRWVKKNAEHFPRAELFGHDLTGQTVQCFMREIDLTARFGCYIYRHATDELSDGVALEAILVLAEDAEQRAVNEAPPNVSFPLRQADVKWGVVGSSLAQKPGYDFYRSLEGDESG